MPVISYRRGGPAEIIVDGETGFLVEPDDVDGLIAAVGRIGEFDRVECRQRVEERTRSRPTQRESRAGSMP